MHACTVSILVQINYALIDVVWVGLAMIWAWTVGVVSVLELVFKKLEPMLAVSLKLFFFSTPLQRTKWWVPSMSF